MLQIPNSLRAMLNFAYPHMSNEEIYTREKLLARQVHFNHEITIVNALEGKDEYLDDLLAVNLNIENAISNDRGKQENIGRKHKKELSRLRFLPERLDPKKIRPNELQKIWNKSNKLRLRQDNIIFMKFNLFNISLRRFVDHFLNTQSWEIPLGYFLRLRIMRFRYSSKFYKFVFYAGGSIYLVLILFSLFPNLRNSIF